MTVFSNNLTIHTGTDFEQTFVLEDGNTNSALNLTGYSGCAKIKKYQSSITAASFSLRLQIALVVKLEFQWQLTLQLI